MKRIHAAYLKSLDVNDLAQLSQGNKDPEFFLPKNCALRSDRGELTRPAGRGPFENYEAFKRSIDGTYWLELFIDHTGRLEAFNELGKRIVTEVCVEQSNKDLRVSSGPKLLGYDKREHVSPLALCLHEIKVWASEQLPNLTPGDPQTHKIIAQRVKYLVMLCPRDVWGSASMLSRGGLSSATHGKLVQLLQRIVMFLTQINKVLPFLFIFTLAAYWGANVKKLTGTPPNIYIYIYIHRRCFRLSSSDIARDNYTENLVCCCTIYEASFRIPVP